MEHILKKSRVCLAGRFNAKQGLRHEDLKSSNWKRIKMSTTEYERMKSVYYSSLLRSMIEIEGEKEQSVYRYEMILPQQRDNLMVLNRKDGQSNYPCTITSIQLWFFPFEIVLFSAELDENANSLDDLTLMHSKWKKWGVEYNNTILIDGQLKDIGFHTPTLDEFLEPLVVLTKDKNPAKLTFEDTKLRQYQVVQSNSLQDSLLFEIGTFSSIGVVCDTNICRFSKPADDYFNKIITENTISAYSNWKALALNDSFTVLTVDEVYSNSENNEYDDDGQLIDTGYHYFYLLYMRCLFEEFYCFDRNNLYHEVKDTDIDSKKIESEIAYMEKHYFFDDMSYDFLPPLMYRAMAKGLELQKDREQLTQHVKQALSEARRERNNSAVNFVQIFAVFSVVWTIREILIAILPCIKGSVSAFISGVIALTITIVLLKWPQLLKRLFKIN